MLSFVSKSKLVKSERENKKLREHLEDAADMYYKLAERNSELQKKYEAVLRLHNKLYNELADMREERDLLKLHNLDLSNQLKQTKE